MTVVVPLRAETLTVMGVATRRFTRFMDDSTNDLNDLTDGIVLDVQEDTDANITLTAAVAFTTRIKTDDVSGQFYTLPPNSELDLALGTWFEIYNLTTLDLSITSDDDLEGTASGATTAGVRTIAAGGFARLVLVDIDDPTWKVTGDQIT